MRFRPLSLALLLVSPVLQANTENKNWIDALEARFGTQDLAAYCCIDGWSKPEDPQLNDRLNCAQPNRKHWGSVSIQKYLYICYDSLVPGLPPINTLILQSGEKISINTTDIETRIKTLNPHVARDDLDEAAYLSCAHALSDENKYQQQIKPKTPQKFSRVAYNRSIFLELNNCVPRTKIFEDYQRRLEAERLKNDGKREEAFKKFQEGCDKNDAESCYVAGISVPMYGEENDVLRLKILKKACALKFPNSCETLENWEGSIQKYRRDKARLSKSCDRGRDSDCVALIKLLSNRSRRMNIPEAKRVASKKCDQNKASFCWSLAEIELSEGRKAGEIKSLIEKACKGGIQTACQELGRL